MIDSALLGQGDVAGWRLNPRVQLLWRHLQGEWLLFEVLSGQTHHLDPVAAAVLTCFESGDVLTPQSLGQLLDADYGSVLTAEQRAAGLAALWQWASLGILVPAPTDERLHAAF